jgi:hypothetical protein
LRIISGFNSCGKVKPNDNKAGNNSLILLSIHCSRLSPPQFGQCRLPQLWYWYCSLRHLDHNAGDDSPFWRYDSAIVDQNTFGILVKPFGGLLKNLCSSFNFV